MRGEVEVKAEAGRASEDALSTSYAEFLARKSQLGTNDGFAPTWLPEFLFDFQRALVEWAVRKGRGAILADCGLGKGPMALVWAENIIRHTNRPVLIATPLAVGHQLVLEGEKFGVECIRVADGRVPSGARVVVTNYERIDKFDPADFAGMVCDESSAIKAYDGVRRAIVTEFLRTLPYRLLCTATAAPNDYIELGTSSEALGELGHMDMLSRFFKNEQNTLTPNRLWADGGKWRFKGHAEQPFWRWVCSWARALRRPSDLGFDDGRFVLPPLEEIEHILDLRKRRDGMLFDLPAVGLREEREERRLTIRERCEKVAELVEGHTQSLVWCDLNDEGDLLEELIDGAQQVSGADSDDAKEEKLLAFASGELRRLVTKPKIASWGLNFQKCAHVTRFPGHSYEQAYQGVRRVYRFGQTRPVRVDIVATPGQRGTMANYARKAAQAAQMFSSLVEHMNNSLAVRRAAPLATATRLPDWMN